MIQAGVIDHLQNRMDGARFRIVRSIHQAAEAGLNGRSRAHGARFNCSKQFALAQTVITEVSSSFAQGDHFGMRGGIVVGDIAIPSASHDLARLHHDRAYGHFSSFKGALRAAEGFFHPQFVGRRQRRGKLIALKLISGSLVR